MILSSRVRGVCRACAEKYCHHDRLVPQTDIAWTAGECDICRTLCEVTSPTSFGGIRRGPALADHKTLLIRLFRTESGEHGLSLGDALGDFDLVNTQSDYTRTHTLETFEVDVQRLKFILDRYTGVGA